MGKSFQFVEKHSGLNVPFQQQMLREQHEKITKTTFTGACVGVVAALLECMLMPRKLSPHTFYNRPALSLYPSPTRSIILQRNYEQDHENFFTVFLREILQVSKTGFPENEGYIGNFNALLSKIDFSIDDNILLLLRPTYKFEMPDKTLYLDHMMCVLKHNGNYLFCDPNIGLAIFSNFSDFKEWLSDEMTSGALCHCLKPEKTTVLVEGQRLSGHREEGLMSVSTSHFQAFSYPSQNKMPNPILPHARL